MGILLFVLGFLALLLIGGMIWAFIQGAPIIGFVLLCLVLGGLVFVLAGCPAM
ncbi:MAG: hypothetical protein SPG64_05880 [Candidatus Enteromonas sp.]|nr:hypothetical protein [Candidatus Enteromonas sp.]